MQCFNIFDRAGQNSELKVTAINSSKMPMDLSSGRVELTNYTKDFAISGFVDSSGKLDIRYNPKGETVSGKSYTLNFNFYPEGVLANSKPISVKYKVTIAK